MRQLLMLGFYCEVYRREPRCRVYVNDILLDEFNIPHTPYKDVWTADMELDPKIEYREQVELQSNILFLKYLELDDADKNSLDIKIEIQNNDNNYSNGFMNKYTRVMLSQCWIASIKCLDNCDDIHNRWKYNTHNYDHSCTGSIAQYYAKATNYIFDNLAMYADLYFPYITQKQYSIEHLKTFFHDYQYLPRLWQESPCRCWVGSNGYFCIHLRKKLGFWRHSTDRRRGSQFSFEINLIKYLYDKYKSYEDTRSTNS